ncbi:class I SAM-dependent methyltransferase [Pedococcus sp. 5OH_020]|uniref:class I SAM-dependent methyltransferase n=1 Tax=Pedococcus sp. 5OH_020 TaxID=2989814 RepID=UPI0022E9AEE8|nr:methyltransferase domain-containing protein [Pedococcus sp. 5OH_020]
MAGCCDPRGCDGVFGNRFARRVASRYRKRGLGGTEQRIVDFLVARDIMGASVLEIGGGVGELHLELLRRGAARATNLELVAAYDAAANELSSEAGVGDRITRRILDIAATPGQVEPADVVVMHRVVCCYPDFERLLGAAADHARRLLVFSHPPRNAASRLVLAAQNTAFRVSGKTFRTFAHPPGQMLAVLGAYGLSPVYAHQGLVWRVAGLERTSA